MYPDGFWRMGGRLGLGRPGSILFSFALFRFMRPYIKQIVCESWIGTVVLIASLIAASAIPEISHYVEPLALDGASGWLWALLGLFEREYVAAREAVIQEVGAVAPRPPRQTALADRVREIFNV